MALSDKEKKFAQVAFKAGLLDQAQLKEADRILAVLKKAGSNKGLPDVLREKGFLTEAQVDKISRTRDVRLTACPDCGTRFRIRTSTQEGQVRCPHCRAVVSVQPEPDQGSEDTSHGPEGGEEQPAAPACRLVCIYKDRDPLVKPLAEGTIQIGRAPESDLVVADSLASKRHAEVAVSADDMIVRDCGSRNGTLVNGERIEEKSLQVGDLIEIGSARLLLLRASMGPVSGTTATGGLTAFDAHCRLTGIKGSKSGYIFPLGSSALTIGSEPSNDIVLDGDDAAEFHAQIAQAKEGARVMDLYTPSGIRVNGDRKTCATLTHGDVLSVGVSEFRFEQVTGETDVLRAAPPEQAQTEEADEDEPTGVFEPTQEERQGIAMRTSGMVAALQEEVERVEEQFGATGNFSPQLSDDSEPDGDEGTGMETEEEMEAHIEEPATHLGLSLS